MCLIVLAIGQSPGYPLILAGNRDEFHARPTQAAHWWPDEPAIAAGRDLQAGGTWLALHRNGRFAAVTNFRDAEPVSAELRSRGHLVTDFLQDTATPADYLHSIDGAAYSGFNLIAGQGDKVAYFSNRSKGVRDLGPGLYGLSNALLDGNWDKVTRTKKGLAGLLKSNAVTEAALLDLLGDRQPGPTAEAETGRLGKAMANAITAPFIVTPQYGTRCSTIMTLDKDARWLMIERRFDSNGEATGESRFDF